MKLKYRVRVGFNDFDFDDPTQAMVFAETAVKKFVPFKPDDEICVEITPIKEEVDNA